MMKTIGAILIIEMTLLKISNIKYFKTKINAMSHSV